MAFLPLPLPEHRYPDLVKLKRLSQKAQEVLADALELAPLQLSHADLSSLLAEKVDAENDDLRAILGVLKDLSMVCTLSDMPVDGFAKSIAEGMNRVGRDELRFSEGDQVAFQQNLTRLLGTKAITVSAKSRSILRAFDNTICHARAMTDARPVFDSSANTINALTIAHSLNITYHHGTDMREFFVTLDTADLELLITVLRRSQEKAAAIRAAMACTDIPIIDAD